MYLSRKLLVDWREPVRDMLISWIRGILKGKEGKEGRG